MAAALQRGDLVIVTRLERLGRSVRELLNLLAEFDKIGVGFRSLADVWCDTTTAHGRLMLTVLGGLAEFERELIRQRTGEGRARALAAGVRFGRKPKLSDFQRKEAMARRGNGEADRALICRECVYDQQALGEENRMGAFTLIPLIVLIAIGVAIGVATRPKNRKRGRELEFTVDPEVERRGAQAEKYLAFQNDVQALTDQIVALCLEYSPTIGARRCFRR
jgi:hypothetical protein